MNKLVRLGTIDYLKRAQEKIHLILACFEFKTLKKTYFFMILTSVNDFSSILNDVGRLAQCTKAIICLKFKITSLTATTTITSTTTTATLH